MARTRNNGRNAAQSSLPAIDLHTAQMQCLAAVEQAWSSDTATDEERLLVAVATACIHRSFMIDGEAFSICPTSSSVVNTAVQCTQTSYKGSKLKTILQLPLLSKAFSRATGFASGKKYAIHMNAVLPNASQHIKSLLPKAMWSHTTSAAGPAPATNGTAGNQGQIDRSPAPAQATERQPCPRCVAPACTTTGSITQ